MGLGISVGMLCGLALSDPEGFEVHRGEFEKLSRGLAQEGIEWSEPQVIHAFGEDDFSAGFPYGYLAHLRRVFTLARLGEEVAPVSAISDEQYERDKIKVDDETAMFSSHLLCHADYAGYYVPVDFADPLFLPEEAKVAGAGMVGSSQQLLAELVGLAGTIGIRLDAAGVLSAADEAALVAADGEAFDAERYTWLQLYRACLASVESGHAIVFC